MSISITEAENNKLMSSRAISILPKKCLCGSELSFSDSLKKLQCSNTNCKAAILYRCNTFCKKTDLNITESELIGLIEKLSLITPYQLLQLDAVYKENLINKLDIQDIENVIQKLNNIKSSEYFMYQIIELSGIEEINNIAKKLFYGFNSVDEIFEEIEASRVIFFNERLGIRSSDSTIISVEIYNKVMSIQEELIFAETQFKVKKHRNVLKVVFADNNIGKFINKAELLEYLENRYEYTFLHTSNICNSTDILIKNGGVSSTKARIARTINEKHIAEQINNGSISLNDIGKFEEGKLKPIGSIIYIDTLEHILDRLDNNAGVN